MRLSDRKYLDVASSVFSGNGAADKLLRNYDKTMEGKYFTKKGSYPEVSRMSPQDERSLASDHIRRSREAFQCACRLSSENAIHFDDDPIVN